VQHSQISCSGQLSYAGQESEQKKLRIAFKGLHHKLQIAYTRPGAKSKWSAILLDNVAKLAKKKIKKFPPR